MKKLLYVIPAVAMAFSMMTKVSANHYPTDGKEWNVTFTGAGDPTDDFRKSSFTDTIQDMQPGDDATFVINLNNQSGDTTKWWMTNTVMDSFEDHSIANGGAYTYRLVYYGPGDAEGTTLYDSMTVGGEDTTGGVGLHEATNALGDESQNGKDNSQRDDYIVLGDIEKGQSGKIVLDIELDGETQGNAYQDTLADLRMNFALEKVTNETPPSPPRKPPNTSDPLSMVPYLFGTGISGIVLLIIVIIRIRDAKEEEA